MLDGFSLPPTYWPSGISAGRWLKQLPGEVTWGLGEQSKGVRSSLPADTLCWGGPGGGPEAQPPGPLPCRHVVCSLPLGTSQSLPNLKFKLCNYTSLHIWQLWGFRDPRFPVLLQEALAGWGGHRRDTGQRIWRSHCSPAPWTWGWGAMTPTLGLGILGCEMGCLLPGELWGPALMKG